MRNAIQRRFARVICREGALGFMVIASKAVIAVSSFVLVAAGGAAIVAGSGGLWQALRGGGEVKVADGGASVEPKADAKSETMSETKMALAAPPTFPPPSASSPPSKDVATALGKAESALADLPTPSAPPPPAAAAEDSGPRFDVARVDEDGEAVIAGRAAPGARVELLRDGETHASAVADASGLFVMTPPKLPAGDYKLSLKSTAPDGAVAQSKASVPVTLSAMAQSPRAAPARTDVAKATKETPAKEESSAPSPGSSQRASQSVLALAAAPAAEKGPLRSKVETTGSIPASRVVTRGDSLWLISRRTYGDGLSYALIYNANRDKIHDPDRIYPGQTFVLPRKAR
jgi:nucleoid-associated protein YgaU